MEFLSTPLNSFSTKQITPSTTLPPNHTAEASRTSLPRFSTTPVLDLGSTWSKHRFFSFLNSSNSFTRSFLPALPHSWIPLLYLWMPPFVDSNSLACTHASFQLQSIILWSRVPSWHVHLFQILYLFQKRFFCCLYSLYAFLTVHLEAATFCIIAWRKKHIASRTVFGAAYIEEHLTWMSAKNFSFTQGSIIHPFLQTRTEFSTDLSSYCTSLSFSFLSQETMPTDITVYRHLIP